jgi:hypothetical protein
VVGYRRDWDGTEWQRFARQLAQERHGAANMQSVPDRVQGDAGIEFYSICGTAYQCYAPQAALTAQAASAMKAKARRDLDKLVANRAKLEGIFGSTRLIRWILFCPYLDDKSVVAAVRQHGDGLKAHGLPYLGGQFEALVQSQEDFETERVRLQRLPVVVVPRAPTGGTGKPLRPELEVVLMEKLQRANPTATLAQLDERKAKYIAAHASRENLLRGMQIDHPVLWERAMQCIATEEKTLELTGARGDAPSEMLQSSLDRISATLRHDLGDVAHASIQEISLGTLADWLMRCPLDFPGDSGHAG